MSVKPLWGTHWSISQCKEWDALWERLRNMYDTVEFGALPDAEQRRVLTDLAQQQLSGELIARLLRVSQQVVFGLCSFWKIRLSGNSVRARNAFLETRPYLPATSVRVQRRRKVEENFQEEVLSQYRSLLSKLTAQPDFWRYGPKRQFASILQESGLKSFVVLSFFWAHQDILEEAGLFWLRDYVARWARGA